MTPCRRYVSCMVDTLSFNIFISDVFHCGYRIPSIMQTILICIFVSVIWILHFPKYRIRIIIFKYFEHTYMKAIQQYFLLIFENVCILKTVGQDSF